MPGTEEETAVRQVEKFGYSRNDVKHIVMTHLHSDHSGGLRAFPDARVAEFEALGSPKGFKEHFYDPAYWAHRPNWVVHKQEEKQNWFGFRNIRIQEGLSPDIRLIPLHGHTRGHRGVAIETTKGWLLHCGDATYPFYHRNDLPRP